MQQDNGFSLDAISRLRGEAHSTVKTHAAQIISLSGALEALDRALMQSVATGLPDDRAALVAAARNLAALLEVGGRA